jgi:hypothetical protein
MCRTRIGKRIELTARDIEIFELLRRYRYLRSTYIHAFVGGASETRFKERLGDLFHEGYVNRPLEQWEFAGARHQSAVYEIGAGALRVLREVGADLDDGLTFLRKAGQRQFLHSLMICEALASLELGARATPALRLIGWPEILGRAPDAIRASPVPFRLPVPSGGYLVPDGLFGIEYRSAAAKTYRFFALEADRGTMPISRSNLGQTSYIEKLTAYRGLIERGAHKTHVGIPNLLVLTLTTSERRCKEIMLRLSGQPHNSAAFLFMAVSGHAFLRPLPMLLTKPWERAGFPPLQISAST